MKNIKSFSLFLNEEQAAKGMVDPSVVKPGMIAKDYNDKVGKDFY